MRGTVLMIGVLLCFTGGVLASFTSLSLQNMGAHVFAPLSLDDAQSPPVAVLLSATIQAIDAQARTMDLEIRDPYAHAQRLILEVHYNEATQMNGAGWNDLRPGGRILALVSRAPGPLYLASITRSKQYE